MKKENKKSIPVTLTVYFQFIPERGELIGLKKDLEKSATQHLINRPPWTVKVGVACRKCDYITDVNPDRKKKDTWYCRNCNGVIVYDL